MKKENNRINIIAGIFALMLVAAIFVMPATADIPIKLKLTSQSHVHPGDTAEVTVMLLDENNNPAVDDSDISIDFSTNLGQVLSPVTIPAGATSSVTQFTSEVPGIAVISVKSKGLISDAVSIEVSNVTQPTSTPTLSVTVEPTSNVTVYVTQPVPTSTETRVEPGFEAGLAFSCLFAVAYLVLRQRK